MGNLKGFDANNVEPNAPLEPIPAGKYRAQITHSEMKPTKNKDGEYLEIEMDVIEGAHTGRKLWDRLVLRHPNEQTVEIAKGTLSAICRATGQLTPSDSRDLHFIPIEVSVGVKRREDTGEYQNIVRGYARAAGDARAPAPGTAPAAVAGAAAHASNNGAPWKRPAVAGDDEIPI